MGDLVTTGFPLSYVSTQPLECFEKERLDVVGLQATRFGTLHLLTDAIDTAGIHRIPGQRPLFEQVLNLFRIEGVIDNLIQTGPNLRLFAVSHSLYQEITKGAPVKLNLPEHIEHLPPQRFAGFFQFIKQHPVHFALAGLFGNQIPKMTDLCLADAVDAPETLFDAVRVPRQIVIDHQVGALQINALTRCICGDQHLDIRVMGERFLCILTILASQSAMNADNGLFSPKKRGDPLLQVAQGIPVFGEYDKFLFGGSTVMSDFFRNAVG